MNIFLAILALVGGFVLLIKGADWFVEGSSSVAKLLKVPTIVIGLTVVALGTSLPEASVSISSALKGANSLAVSNVVGSNIFNTMLILGITAMIAPLTITKSNINKDIPLNIGVTVLLILLGMNASIFGAGENVLSRLDGGILLAIFAWYMWNSFRSDSADTDSGEEIRTYTPVISTLLILGGLAALIFGGRLFVNAATEIAKGFGVSDKFIAVTVLAAGTSMPELATSVVAAIKGRGQLALGNILGSNISNILLILGGSALITPLSFTGMSAVDLCAVLLSALFILFSAYAFKKKQLDRIEGSILVLMEAGYMWYLISNL